MSSHPPLWGGFWGPKIDQNRTQNASKIKTFSRAKKMLFKSLLKPSWADLDPFLTPSWTQKTSFRIGICSISWKITFLENWTLQTDLGTILGRFWANLAPNMAPKWHPKTTKKRTKKQHEKRTKTTTKKSATWTKKPDPAVNGKRRLQMLFVI